MFHINHQIFKISYIDALHYLFLHWGDEESKKMKFKDMHSVDETDTNGLDIGALCMQLSTCSNTISAVLSPHSSSTHIFLSPTILHCLISTLKAVRLFLLHNTQIYFSTVETCVVLNNLVTAYNGV